MISFLRENNDIYLECEINYHDAVLGTEIKVHVAWKS